MDSVCIDCHYLRPGKAGVYLIVDKDEAAFVDVNAPGAVPHMLGALSEAGMQPEQVRYLLLTHVHLDHGGGSGAMIEACPNAEVIVHPAGRPHLLEPERLVRGSRMVYGEALFAQVYGEIRGLPPERVREVDDGEEVSVGRRRIACLHTPGHTKHHLCFHDAADGAVYTGDVFGSCYEPHRQGMRPLVFCSNPPTDFDFPKMRAAIDRIESLGPARLGPTHFGFIEDVGGAAGVLRRTVDAMEGLLEEMWAPDIEDDALEAETLDRVFAVAREIYRECGIDSDGEGWDLMEGDLRMNAQGIAYRVKKLREKERQDQA